MSPIHSSINFILFITMLKFYDQINDYAIFIVDRSVHIRYHIVYTVYGSTRSTLSIGIGFERYEFTT